MTVTDAAGVTGGTSPTGTTGTAAPPVPAAAVPGPAAEDDAGDDHDAPVERTPRRLVVAAAVPIVLFTFLQRFGEIVSLTRLDRVLDPGRMAARDLDLWNPYWDLGAPQFQTIGYWIPFDAWFGIGAGLGVPPWWTERIFMAALLVVALWGVVRLADALRIGRPVFRVIAAVAYTTSPLVLSRVGWQHVFAMGTILLPWALVPLVRGAAGGSTRRAAARSALAIALIGGGNAAVTFAVLPVPLLYLLTRERGPRRASLLRWWALCVPLATAWWLVGVALYARYGPDVLAYTEQIEDIVRFTPVFEVLRGTADWVMRLGAIDPAGTWFALRAVAIAVTAIVAALGLAGLASRRLPERTFLVLCLLAGVVAVGGGYDALIANPAADAYRALLGGPLGAFRNVFKFQPLVLLPTSLGLAHVLTQVADHRLVGDGRIRRTAVITVSLVLVAAAAWPLWSDKLTKGPGFAAVPQAWEQVQDHVAGAEARVLVVPGVPDADFEWGFTAQLPVQWGSDATWATRSQAPLSGPESLEVLDTVELAIERGGDTNLPAYLRRAGFSTVVVPNDLVADRVGAPPPEVVAEALRASGLEREARFGRGGYGFGDLRQVEVYAVPDPARVRSYPASATTWLSGDVESTLHVPTATFGERPYLLVEDDPPATVVDELRPAQWIVTDGNPAVTVNHGLNRNNRSYVHGPADAPFGDEIDPEHHTVLSLDGFTAIEASSVGPGIFVRDSPASAPANTVDGDPDTSWQPLRYDTSGDDQWGTSDPWIQYVFDAPRPVDELRIELLVGVLGVDAGIGARVDTDAGTATTQLRPVEDPQRLGVPDGATSRLRITLDRRSVAEVGDVIGIREVTVPGAPVTRRLAVPDDLGALGAGNRTPDPAWVFTRAGEPVSPLVAHDSESQIRRVFDVHRAGTVTMTATATAAHRDRLVRELGVTPTLAVAADSTWGDRPEVAPRNLVDDDPTTIWRSAVTTDRPAPHAVVWLDWAGNRHLSRLRLDVGDSVARPRSVVVRHGDEVRRAAVDEDGWAAFDQIGGDDVEITVHYARSPLGAGRPIGLTGIHVPALADLAPGPVDRSAVHRVRCADGLGVTVDGTRHAFSAATTVGALIEGTPIELEPCGSGSLRLDTGRTTLDAASGSSLLTIDQVVIGDPATVAVPAETPRAVEIDEWGSSSREVTLAAGARSLLVVNEIHNEGWTATIDGAELPSVRVDGWRQGFVVPAGDTGVVRLTYGPQRVFRVGTALGLLALLGVAALALWPARRGDRRGALRAGVAGLQLLAVLTVLGAVWTVGAAAAALPLLWWARARHPAVLPWVAFGGLAGAALTTVVAERLLDLPSEQWGSASTTVGALAALSLLSVLATLLPAGRRG